MTNNEIVEIVYRTYKVQRDIKNMARESVNDNSYKDLEQYIYYELLRMSNEKLNDIYNNNKLNVYIWNMIRNQRNYYKNEYQKTRFKDSPELNDNIVYIDEYVFDYEWLDYELNKFDWNKPWTKKEEKMALEYEMFKFYITSNYSMKKIAGLWNCSVSKIQTIINHAKKNIKKSYIANYEKWNEQWTNENNIKNYE